MYQVGETPSYVAVGKEGVMERFEIGSKLVSDQHETLDRLNAQNLAATSVVIIRGKPNGDKPRETDYLIPRVDATLTVIGGSFRPMGGEIKYGGTSRRISNLTYETKVRD